MTLIILLIFVIRSRYSWWGTHVDFPQNSNSSWDLVKKQDDKSELCYQSLCSSRYKRVVEFFCLPLPSILHSLVFTASVYLHPSPPPFLPPSISLWDASAWHHQSPSLWKLHLKESILQSNASAHNHNQPPFTHWLLCTYWLNNHKQSLRTYTQIQTLACLC